MKAVVYNRKNRPARLEYVDIEKPVPGDDELLVRVHAVSLNAADYRSMQMGLIPRHRIFGADIAGVVEAAGRHITAFAPGDEVIGDLATSGFGGLAEYALAPERLLIKKPASLSFAAAAAMPMASMTALQALRDKGGIKEGDRVLIVGSAGGVGTFAVQLAKYFGAEVTGVCSSANTEQTLALGADSVIDYTREEITAGGKRYDIILGINGSHPLLTYRRMLAPGGTFVMVGGSLGQVFRSLLFGRLLSTRSARLTSLAAKAGSTDLALLADLAAGGVIKSVIAGSYTLAEAPEAMTLLRRGHTPGKVVITVIP